MKNGKLTIERGIPIPTDKWRKGYSDYLRALKVVESVVLPNNTNSANALIRQVKAGVRLVCKAEFTARKVDDSHTRVWRVK